LCYNEIFKALLQYGNVWRSLELLGGVLSLQETFSQHGP